MPLNLRERSIFGLAVVLCCLLAWPSRLNAQAIAKTSNALDRIRFGETGTDASSETAHGFINLGNPTGTGALGQTWREIAPSTTAANVGNPAYNQTLTFTMVCDPTLQNYLTLQLWGSDTTLDVIYLYTATQGYQVVNYYSTNQPEIDYQETADPAFAGRFLYDTVAIPLAMTTGKTSVTLTLNAAQSFYYYNNVTTNLPAGTTSRPIYSAFTHTNPYLILNPADPQGTAPAASAPTPAALDATYLSGLTTSIATLLQTVQSNQIYGTAWSAAIAKGTVPAQIYGYFDAGKSPSNTNTTAQWLNNAAIDTSAGNNVAMERLDMLAYVYSTPGIIPSLYKSTPLLPAIYTALDSYSFMQSLNGSWGDMTAWNGVGATTATVANPYGRTNAQGSPIEGAGTWAIGSAIVDLSTDSSFLSALDQPISATLEPGVMRYQAYQAMLSAHLAFLGSAVGYGHAPNQDLLQARAYVYTNLALQFLDKRYGTSLAVSNATVLAYCQLAAGLTVDPYGGYWFSLKGLGLEVNGTGNGSFDGGYGLNDEHLNLSLAKILADNGLETATSHPIRDIALSGVASFSNFLQPGLLATGSAFTTTQRIDEDITFRKNLNVGEVEPGGDYYAAGTFADPYSIHGMYREKALGITWTLPAFGSGHFDDIISDYLHEFANYSALCAKVNSTSDTTGVTYLQEAAHPDGVFVDPTGSSLAVKYQGETLDMVLNFRPLQVPGTSGVKPIASKEIVDNIARVHDTTATIDRVATIAMPATTATGASGSYSSGAFGTLYIGRYGNYLSGLNWQSNAVSMTLAPDMTAGTATDVATGVNYDLTQTSVISVPAQSGVVLYQSLPTATLSATAVNLGTVAPGSSATQTVTLSNSGTGPLLIGATSLSGINATDYNYTTTCVTSLAAGASCTISFTFTPSASGSRIASFSLLTCLSKVAQIVTLTGTANVPTLTVAPASFSRFFDTPNPVLTYTLSGFTGGDTQANATTGAPALTTLATRTSPGGTYAIAAGAGTLQSSKYFFQFATGTLTVTGGAPQRIYFAPLASLTNGATLRLAASTSSGLPVTFSVVSGPATISGTLLTTTGTGTVVVNAAQAGDATYAAAALTSRSLSVQ